MPTDSQRPAPPPATATRLLLRGVGRNKARLSGGFALLALWQTCETMVPVLIGVIIDEAVATSDLTRLVVWLIGLSLLFTVLSLSYRFGARLGFGVVQSEMHRIRVEISAHALHPRGARSKLLSGETLSLATADAEMVGLVLRSLGFTIAAFLALLVAAWVLIGINLALGVIVLLGVPTVLVVIQVITPVIARRTHEQQASVAEATGVATDLVRGLRVLKGVGAEDVASRRYADRSRTARLASVGSADSFGTMEALTVGLSGIFLAVVAVVAGRLAMAGEISVGELVAVVGLTQFIAEPISMLGHISAQAARAHASAGRIVAFLHTPPMVAAGAREPDPGSPAVPALRSVHAGTLSGFAASSRPGELLGLAVEDPADAAQVVRLLTGEVAPSDVTGEITLSGVPLAELSTDARRRWLAVNPHHVDLFEGTLRSNIDPHGRLDAARLGQILAATATDDVVALSAAGLDQPVTANGSTFSGGQRQRVALARALAADVPVLVLHDPTTAVDAVTEQRIADGIRDLRHAPGSDRVTWVVTSSPALLARADRVLVVRDGRAVLDGTHQELVADSGYQEMVLR